MLSKRLFLGALFLTVLVNINGCGTTGKYESTYETQYRIASDECIRFGHRRGSYDFRRCVEKRINIEK